MLLDLGARRDEVASITRQKNGRKIIQFVDVDGKRKSVRLGKVSLDHAETVRTHIEHLVAARLMSEPVSNRTALWFKEISDELKRRISATGIIASVATRETRLGRFVDYYIENRTKVKESTKTTWKRTKKHLLEFFGEDRDVTTVTAGDAKDFRNYLVRRGMAENTIRRTTGIAKQFFEDCLDREMIARNPFKHRDLPTSTSGNTDRMHFVKPDVIKRVIDACSNHDWRLVVALCRFGGLRCPSEVHALKWPDVDWQDRRIRVTSPKTERYKGQESRTIPLFPELEPYLAESFELAEVGADHVVAIRTQNMRTTMEKIIQRAKVKPWPRLFQNLRSSRQTELEEQFPSHVVCAWLGNSPRVAHQHYLQVTDDHFEKAVQKAVHQTGPEQQIQS